jgi:hypothetical protein
MNSKLLRIMAVGLTTLFLSAQAFPSAADNEVGDKTDRDISPMCSKSVSDQSTDRAKSDLDKGSNDTSKSNDMDQSQNSLFDVFPPMPN